MNFELSMPLGDVHPQLVAYMAGVPYQEGDTLDVIQARLEEVLRQPRRITSVACRPCSRGWYGNADDRCSKCRGPVVVTDSFMSVPLR